MSSWFPFYLPWHDWYLEEYITPNAKVFKVVEGFRLAVRDQIEPTRPISENESDLYLTRAKEGKNALEFLVRLAKQGHPGAANDLVSIVAKACAELSALAPNALSIFRSIARRRFKWPVMKSLSPFLGDDHETLLKNLQLGAELPMELDAGARGKLDTAGEIAYCLLTHVWQMVKIATKYYDSTLRAEINALDKFSDDSKDDGWKVAKVCFLNTYPNPEKILELNELVTAETHRKSAGRIKRSILGLLKARFLSFAPAMG